MIRRLPWPSVMAAVASLLLLALTTYAWNERYWRWRDCFNAEGRCYDSQAGVMVAQSGVIWGGLSVLFLVVFAAACAHLLYLRSTTRVLGGAAPGR
ncbi:hypothetical protein VDF90_20820 [Xanthomonas campestris pv. raphani]|uniref:hypothetical protein n=1 Tax=Xanthomonas campestris TaxID=339 RepID=UPI002B23420B|nr:hypothetical protein [Xanthomonas campestris]MEA9789642.1 hypothetical protein [Xanthomonas campestris pv. raphani]